MSEETILLHCSPVLAGIKTGNIFTCRVSDRSKLFAELKQLNLELVDKGLQVIPLVFRESSAIIYIYRPDSLREDLSRPLSRKILLQCGYRTDLSGRAGDPAVHHISFLSRRLSECGFCGEFPHEIGLFLGYPAEDVEGFIIHRGKNCKCSGVWKVYGDSETAQKKFRQFQNCTRCYLESSRRGMSLRQLAVSRPSEGTR